MIILFKLLLSRDQSYSEAISITIKIQNNIYYHIDRLDKITGQKNKTLLRES